MNYLKKNYQHSTKSRIYNLFFSQDERDVAGFVYWEKKGHKVIFHRICIFTVL